MNTSGLFNGGAPHVPLDIAELPSFTEQAGQLGVSAQELDEMTFGVLFNIARVPYIYEQIFGRPGLPICVVDYDGPPTDLRIWFTYDAALVSLLGIAWL